MDCIERRTTMLRKIRIALAVTLLALAAVSAVDSASAIEGHDFSFFSTMWHGYMPSAAVMSAGAATTGVAGTLP
jgi:hypothetical protein